MTLIIIIFGLMTLIAGFVMLVNPEIIFNPLRKNIENISLHMIAISTRALIGVLLVMYASESHFPIIIEILGWLSITAAVSFMVMGRRNFISLIVWALTLLKIYGRIGGLFAALFGGFLVYAFM